MDRLLYSYDPVTDVLTVEGNKFSGEFFRNFAAMQLNRPIRITGRADGVVMIEELSVGQDLEQDAESILQEIESTAERFLGGRARMILNAVAKLRAKVRGPAS